MQPIPQQQSLNKWAKQLGKTTGQNNWARCVREAAPKEHRITPSLIEFQP
ncbi:MAG: hypothetical protein F6J94_09920 [Moorea sp. SIO1F2]|nr:MULTISPECIES: hypothetical protein [unclassified Moorena]NEO08021.1 hypothetical protein [Moorena sp. SIO3I8]NEO22782.1 hypothetical protein [Moorena sp. SIO4A5]NEP23610.1 hypothetical protein [Moorena sp. SIO3I6]NEQ55874.1 hypothetical protein [Moorena sp. SIO4A1]NET82239.1 hypothetical protein [Moorena sp. SIO1F2]